MRARQLGSAPRHVFGPTLGIDARVSSYGRRLALGAAGAALVLLSACGDGEDAPPCSVLDNEDGTATLRCPDGSEYVIASGKDGKNGSDGADGTDGSNGAPGTDGEPGSPGAVGEGCQSSEKVDDTITITCGEFTNTIVDGADGSDGTSCTITDNGAGPALVCNDGTSVPIVDGEDGTSCSVVDNGDGTRNINCTDGTSATIAEGRNGTDGSSCSVGDNGDGTLTMSCGDGTTVTWNKPRTACSLRFEDVYAAAATSPAGFYAAAGINFVGQPITVVGGVSQDASSHGVEGTVGPAAALFSLGSTDIGFSPGVRTSAIDLVRAQADANVVVSAWHNNTLVTAANVVLTAAEPVKTVRFEGFAMESIRVQTNAEIGVDNVRYAGVTCPAD